MLHFCVERKATRSTLHECSGVFTATRLTVFMTFKDCCVNMYYVVRIVVGS